MSLRRRLAAGMLVLLVVGIAVTDVATRLTLRTFLYGRLDEQVDVAQNEAYSYIETSYRRAVAAGERTATTDPGAWLAALATPVPVQVDQAGSGSDVLEPAPVSSPSSAAAGAAPTTTTPSGVRGGRLNQAVLSARVGPDIYVEVLDSGGHVLFRRPSGSSGNADPAPVLPRHLPVRRVPAAHRFGTSHGTYLPDQPSFTVPARGSSGPYYRGEALAVPGGVLVTAVALAPTVQTLKSLTRVEAVVSGVVVVALIVLVLWIVRFGLRPLDEMTATARAIAGGDMRRRIRRTDERSEVGRLGSALNGMLSQIDAAFAERSASESRLRRFVADASHELRTPLTSIRGYAELLRKGALGDEAARHRAAERIEHEAARMGVLVDDLLLLARLDQGRPIEHERVDLGRVVADAVEAARASDPGRPVELTAGPDAIVEGDAVRLRQVVDNLLANASVHTPPGTPVHVSVERAGPEVVLVVTDEGPGLGPGQLERVFDRFYRASEARSRPGSGLGLSIVSALAEAHGGRAEVTSDAGSGATFRVVLPHATTARPAPAVAEGDAQPAPTDGAPERAGDGNIGGDERTIGAPARR